MQQDVAAYRAHSPGAEERAIGRRQPRRKLDDDPTDWEAFYANRKRQAGRWPPPSRRSPTHSS